MCNENHGKVQRVCIVLWRDTFQSLHENWQRCERGEFKFILKFGVRTYQLHFMYNKIQEVYKDSGREKVKSAKGHIASPQHLSLTCLVLIQQMLSGRGERRIE